MNTPLRLRGLWLVAGAVVTATSVSSYARAREVQLPVPMAVHHEISRGAATASSAHTGAASSVSITGPWVVTGGADKVVRIWDHQQRLRLTLTGVTDIVWRATLAPDQHHLALVGVHGHARIVRLPILQTEGPAVVVDMASLRNTWDLGKDVSWLSFSPDGQSVLAGRGNNAEVWPMANRTKRLTLTGHRGKIWATQFSPDGHRIVTASNDGTTRVWNLSTGAELFVVSDQLGFCSMASFSSQGNDLVVVGKNKTIVVDANTGSKRFIVKEDGYQIQAALFSADERFVIAGGPGGHISLYDARTGQQVRQWLSPDKSDVFSLAVTKQGVYTTHKNGQVRVWPLGKEVAARPARRTTLAISTP